ncbi:MAG: DUF3137 domain-containing protein [Alphaproteobacteria bacterium]
MTLPILEKFKIALNGRRPPLPKREVESLEEQAFIDQSRKTLEELEIIRLTKLKMFEFRKKIGIAGATILIPLTGYIDYWLIFLSGSDSDGAGLSVIMLGAIYWWVTGPKRQYAKSYKIEILPKLAKLFGNFEYGIDYKIPIETMQPSQIVPAHDRYKSEDYFKGTYKGIDIEFSEIDLQQRRRSKNRTYYVSIFKGLAILLDMQRKKFYGHTILDMNKGKLGEWFKEKSVKLKRARMVDPEFEKIFDAYTNDQVEARYLIDPVMIERLKGLYKEYNGEKMTVAYFENKVLILIASPYNHFEPADIYTPATDTQSLLNMKHEIAGILSIIDKLDFYDPQELHRQSAKNNEAENA